jgi:hypothetical protein
MFSHIIRQLLLFFLYSCFVLQAMKNGETKINSKRKTNFLSPPYVELLLDSSNSEALSWLVHNYSVC